MTSRRPRRWWRLALGVPVLALLLALAAAALLPVKLDSRDELFEIPPGTWAKRRAGDLVEILPDTLHLTLGANDVLLLHNRDEVPQVFGPALLMPGQRFRLPFEVASTYSFACTAHASGQMNVVVDPPLTPGWSTLRWRWRAWIRAVLRGVPTGAGNPRRDLEAP